MSFTESFKIEFELWIQLSLMCEITPGMEGVHIFEKLNNKNGEGIFYISI